MLIVSISRLVDCNIELAHDFGLHERSAMYIAMFSGL